MRSTGSIVIRKALKMPVTDQSVYLGPLDRNARSALYRDEMRFSERVGEIAGICFTILVVGFFAAHLLWDTGFFTSEFAAFDIILFFSAISFGIVTAVARAVVGRRNAVRPIEIAGYVLGAFFSFWFLVSFPFDFSHFGDVLPFAFGFMFSWIPRALGMAALLVGGLACVVAIVYVTVLFLKVHSMLLDRAGTRSRAA